MHAVLWKLNYMAAFFLLISWSMAEEADWPREIEALNGTILVYTPQLESFEGDKLTARAAVSVTPQGEEEPTFGAAWFEARVSTDRDERTVTLLDIKVKQAKFPHADPAKLERFGQLVKQKISSGVNTLSLDRILAELKLLEKEQEQDRNFKNDPPKIIFVTYPAVLVTLDGEPVLQQMENTTAMQVVNTPFFMVLDPDTALYFLKGDGQWYSAREVDGSWKSAKEVPSSVKVAATLDQSAPQDSAPQGETTVPRIMVVKEPAELISTDGEPKYSPISGTGLLYMSNTESDLFMEIESQKHFVLLSGRWYITDSLKEGPWTYVDTLPPSFSKIPDGSEKADVLTSVAGTEAAEDAVLDTYIPQTAAVDRKEATLTVTYDGNPQFEPIEDTEMKYAVNTTFSVILAEGRYYCCHEAIWFEAHGPLGPWTVCDSVPDIIYTIPPSCPLYNAKYVEVYDSTPDVVYVGYYPGYTGCYTYRRVVVYGTGWRYRPWRGRWYYPRPATWGFSVRYNPVTGNWGFRVGVRGPGAWFGVGYHGRRSAWWGPAGYRTHRAVAHRNHNIYHRHKSAVRRNTPAKTTARATTRKKTSTQKKSNNVYADRGGNVHRKTDRGWEQRDKSGWSNKNTGNQSSRSNLDRQYNARQRGTQRTNNHRQQATRSRGGGRGRR